MEYVITIKMDEEDFILLNNQSKEFAEKNGIKPNRSNYIRSLIRRDK